MFLMEVYKAFIIISDTYFPLKNLLFSLCKATQHLRALSACFNLNSEYG